MAKIFGIVASAAFAMTSTMALAGGGNSDNAKAMAENIKQNGGQTAAAISPNGDLTSLSDGPSDSGWGNAGSDTFGEQVSKSNKPE